MEKIAATSGNSSLADILERLKRNGILKSSSAASATGFAAKRKVNVISPNRINSTVAPNKPHSTRQKQNPTKSTARFTCRHCGSQLEGNFVCIECTAAAAESSESDNKTDSDYFEPKPKASKTRSRPKKASTIAKPMIYFCTECRRNYATLDFLKDHGQFVHQPPLQRKRKTKHERRRRLTTATYSIVRHNQHYVLLATDPVMNGGQCRKLPSQQEISDMITEWECGDSGQFNCPKCVEIFGTLEDVGNHLQTIDHKQSDELFHCEECNADFESWNVAQMHRIKVHTSTVKSPELLDEKSELEPVADPLNDEISEESDTESFKKFMESFRSDDDDDDEDEYNECEVEWLIDDVEPKKRPATDVVDDKTCTYCMETFRSKLLRDVHEQFKHKLLTTERRSVSDSFGDGNWCKYCRRHFATRKTLSHHLQAKHGKSLKTGRYKCRLCVLEFGLSTARTKHERLKHADAKTMEYHCTQCTKTYRRPELLAAHTLSHFEIKPFICDQCGRSFTMDKYLRQHKELHQVNGIHTCDICQRSFNRPYSLTKHKRTHDPASRKQCDLCGKSFADPRDFQRHLFSHGNHDKEFACHLCSHQAYIQTDLNRHLRTIHRIYQPDFKTRAPIC